MTAILSQPQCVNTVNLTKWVICNHWQPKKFWRKQLKLYCKYCTCWWPCTFQDIYRHNGAKFGAGTKTCSSKGSNLVVVIVQHSEVTTKFQHQILISQTFNILRWICWYKFYSECVVSLFTHIPFVITSMYILRDQHHISYIPFSTK